MIIMTGSLESVRRAKSRYCRLVDTRRWVDLAELLDPMLQARIINPDGELIHSFEDRTSFVAATQAFLEGANSIHQIHNDEIDQISESVITAIWSMEDVIVFPRPRDDQPAKMQGFGHYHEVWRYSEDRWRLTRLELRRTILQITDALEHVS